MKKHLVNIPAFIVVFCMLILSCQKKDTSGLNTPGYKEETGTGGNPFPNNPTVTGTPTSTNPATQNSSLYVGGPGWSNPSCSSTGSVTLIGINGSINVTLNFLTTPATGTYVISASPGANACTMVVNNAPNQPAGTVWYGKSGIVAVNTSTNSSINASFSGIVCTQASFNFPTVSVNGNVGCN